VQVNERSDPGALWAIIVATAGMHLDPGDGDDAGQSVKIQYQIRYQSSHESLLSYYNATQLLIKNMILLDVPDAPTGATAASDFLSKMDMGRYGNYYAQLHRNVRIGVEQWPILILAAYEDVEASVLLATASRGSESRTKAGPAVFNVTTGVPRERRGNGPPSAEVLAKNPCKGCGKFGHWLRECPTSDIESKDARQSKKKRGGGVRGGNTVIINVEPQGEGDEDYSTSIFMTTLERVCKSAQFTQHDVIFDSGAEAHVFRDDFFLKRSDGARIKPKSAGWA
jgi:hypothetical protein